MKAFTTRFSSASDGGSCTSSGPRRLPRPPISSRNCVNGLRARRSRPSCVIERGSFTAKRNDPGVAAAQRAYVARECAR